MWRLETTALKILFLSSWFPVPPDNGSKIRIAALLAALSRKHDVKLLTLSQKPPDPKGVEELESRGIRCEFVRVPVYEPNSVRSWLNFLSPRPRSIASTSRRQVGERISREVQGEKADLVVASELKAAAYARHFQGVPSILEDLECGFFANRAGDARSALRRWRRELTNRKLRFYVADLLQHFSSCTVVSQVEKKVLKAWVPNYPSVHVIPNCLRLQEYEPVSGCQESAAIFPGSISYGPNRQAMHWFHNTVLPLVVREIGDFRVYVTGESPARVQTDSRLVWTGYLSRERFVRLFGRVKLCVVPLLEGGGTRVKILESMALGVPVVSTPRGAQGLDVVSGVQLHLAESPQEFANAMVQLLLHAGEREKLSAAGRAFVLRKHDCRQVLSAFLRLVSEVGGSS